jgi:transposase-like protein
VTALELDHHMLAAETLAGKHAPKRIGRPNLRQNLKARTGPMLGFKRFKTAAITLAGIELMRRIYKRQFDLSRLRLQSKTAPEIWNTVLAE